MLPLYQFRIQHSFTDYALENNDNRDSIFSVYIFRCVDYVVLNFSFFYAFTASMRNNFTLR